MTNNEANEVKPETIEQVIEQVIKYCLENAEEQRAKMSDPSLSKEKKDYEAGVGDGLLYAGHYARRLLGELPGGAGTVPLAGIVSNIVQLRDAYGHIFNPVLFSYGPQGIVQIARARLEFAIIAQIWRALDSILKAQTEEQKVVTQAAIESIERSLKDINFTPPNTGPLQ